MSLPQPSRRLLFPVLALGLSLLVLAGLELGLRLLGAAAFEPDPFVGFAGSHPFFVKVGQGDQARYKINPRHQQFFNSVSFPAWKPEGSFRVFVAGGSSARGFPFFEPGSFARFLQVGLDLLEPGRPHQVINAGAFGYASYRVARVVEEVLNYEPDLVVVMTGHNEFLEKRIYGEREQASPALIAVRSCLDRLRLYRELRQAVTALRPSPAPLLKEEVAWEKYSRDSKQVALTLDHYRYNLEKIVRLCRERNVPVVFLTLPSNLKDFPPYRSQHGKQLNPEASAQWEAHYQRGLSLLAESDSAAAVLEFDRAMELDSGYAALQYARGRALLEQGRPEMAELDFGWAVQLDAWPVRAFPEMNAAVREMAARGAIVADALALFTAAAKDRIPGNDLFLDHCHPTLAGQALLAQSVLLALAEKRVVPLPENWRPDYQQAARRYQESLGQGFLGEAYYRAAVEVGVKLARPQEGLGLAEAAFRLAPDHPKLPRLLERLRQEAAAKAGAPLPEKP